MRTTTTAHFLQAFATVLALASVAGAAHAQAPSDADREAQRIQREQQELQRQQIEQQRRKLPAPQSGLAAPEREVTADNGGPCRDISAVNIGSAPNLPPTDRSRIIKAYAGRCLRVHDIEQLMAEITNAYIGRGYVTTRVYLPQQDLSKGQLSVMVVEGVVEKISVHGQGGNRVSLASALPGVQGEPLNLRDLEQGLDQINRLQSNHATLDIEPGTAAGTSRVVIHNERDRAFHFGATLDDMGADTTGKHQAGVTGAYDSPLGLNDFASLTYRQGLPLNVSERYSRLGSFAYLIPYGYTHGFARLQPLGLLDLRAHRQRRRPAGERRFGHRFGACRTGGVSQPVEPHHARRIDDVEVLEQLSRRSVALGQQPQSHHCRREPQLHHWLARRRGVVRRRLFAWREGDGLAARC